MSDETQLRGIAGANELIIHCPCAACDRLRRRMGEAFNDLRLLMMIAGVAMGGFLYLIYKAVSR